MVESLKSEHERQGTELRSLLDSKTLECGRLGQQLQIETEGLKLQRAELEGTV